MPDRKMPEGYGLLIIGKTKKMKKKKYGENFSHISSGIDKLKKKAAKKGSMTYETIGFMRKGGKGSY